MEVGRSHVVVTDTGTIDSNDSAYPQATVLPDGRLLCSYSNSGGSLATGGTDWSASTDGGRTWSRQGTILPREDEPPSSNFLKLTSDPEGQWLYAYGARLSPVEDPRFGSRDTEAIMCRSADLGVTWSAPSVVPMPGHRLEVSHGVLALGAGRLLAPAATIAVGKLGERVVVAPSVDDGYSWQEPVTVAFDPSGRNGYLEHKLCYLGAGQILATFWTVRMSDMADLPNSFSLSSDAGLTWTSPAYTDTEGQTLSTLPLGPDTILAVYNRRHRDPAIVAAVVRLRERVWSTVSEAVIYQPIRKVSRSEADAVLQMNAFGFGFPTAVRLPDHSILITFWSVDDGQCGVRWARLEVVQ